MRGQPGCSAQNFSMQFSGTGFPDASFFVHLTLAVFMGEGADSPAT